MIVKKKSEHPLTHTSDERYSCSYDYLMFYIHRDKDYGELIIWFMCVDYHKKGSSALSHNSINDSQSV